VNSLDELKERITAAIADVKRGTLQRVWQEMDYRWDVCCAVKLFFFKLVYSGVESNWVHLALQPVIGLLCQTQVIMMMEKLVE
jgi:hypothetical protein